MSGLICIQTVYKDYQQQNVAELKKALIRQYVVKSETSNAPIIS